MHADGVLGGAATLGGKSDPGAAAIGPVLGALYEAAVFHARQLVRDAALIPVESQSSDSEGSPTRISRPAACHSVTSTLNSAFEIPQLRCRPRSSSLASRRCAASPAICLRREALWFERR
jgi:hypothetical protein